MTSYFERLIDFVGAHPQLSFLAVFLLALSEAVPVIGTVVPGSTLILAISALAMRSLPRCSEQLPATASHFGSDIVTNGRCSAAGRSIAFPG